MDELRALRAVVILDEERSFSRTAARLGLSQSSVSRLLQAYEAELGVALFDRSSRSVEPTSAATALLDDARRAVEHAELAVRHARHASDGAIGVLRFGHVAGAANVIAGEAVARMRHQWPGVTVEEHQMSVADQVDAIHAGEIDVGLVRAPSSPTGPVVARELYRAPFALAVPSEHDLAARGGVPVPLRELSGQPLVMWPRAMAPRLHDALFDHLRRGGVDHVRIVAVNSDTLARLGLVAAGVGLSLVTAGTAATIERRGVRHVHLEDPPTSVVALVHGPRPAPAVPRFVDVCVAVAARWAGGDHEWATGRAS